MKQKQNKNHHHNNTHNDRTKLSKNSALRSIDILTQQKNTESKAN